VAVAPSDRLRGGFARLFGGRRPLIGVVHLLPLPGSPRAAPIAQIVARARADVRTWFSAGADAVLVENYGDRPFFPDCVPAVTVAAMARVCAEVVALARGPVGVNVLRNDACAAVSIAAACSLDFVRVNVLAGASASDQGLLLGRAHEVLRLRAQLGGGPLVFADLRVKHAVPLVERPVADEARDLAGRALADALLATGPATGSAPDAGLLEELRAALPQTPLLVASGATPEGIAATRGLVDGWIAGTFAKRGGVTEAPPQRARIRQLLAARDRPR